MTYLPSGRRRLLPIGAVIALSVALSACGSSSSSSSSPSSSSSSSAAASTTSSASSSSTPIAYTGPEKNLPHTLAEPTIKPGFHYKVGFMSPNASIGSLTAVINGAKAETQKLGGTMILKDAQANINLQATQINELVAQKVNAAMVYPLNPVAMAPGLSAAQKAGIPIVMEDTPPIAGSPLIPGTSTNVLQGRDTAEFGTAQAGAKAAPGGKFVTLGLAIPVPLLQYGVSRVKYWSQKAGMKYLGEVDATGDTSATGAAAMTTILAKYPNVDVVYAYNDQAAEAAAAVARSNGKLNIKVFGGNGEPVAIQQIQAGRMFGTFNSDFTSIGRLMAIAAYDLLTKQHLPLPKQVVVGGVMVTQANAANANPLGAKGPIPPATQ